MKAFRKETNKDLGPEDKGGFIPFSLPSIGDEEIEAVSEVLRSGWITTGPVAKAFEEEFASYVGAAHAVALNSCTAALHLALETVGLKSAEAVITSPLTFAATAEVVRYFDARPVFIDIEPGSMNMDASLLDEKISSLKKDGITPRAVIAVHYAGLPSDMDTVMEIARRHGVFVIEDAAHALSASYKGRPVGSIGDITCFSFYASKNITTAEGGMATTDNPEWAKRMRIMSLHGIDRDAWMRHRGENTWRYEIVEAGYKYNLTDMAAAMGLVQLRKAGGFLGRRTEIASVYDTELGGIPQISLPVKRPPGDVVHAWHLYVLRLDLEMLVIDRDRFIQELKSRGVGASVHFIPLHIHPYYRDMYGYVPGDFPAAYDAYGRVVSLPIYPAMSDGDVQRAAAAVLDVAEKFKR